MPKTQEVVRELDRMSAAWARAEEILRSLHLPAAFCIKAPTDECPSGELHWCKCGSDGTSNWRICFAHDAESQIHPMQSVRVVIREAMMSRFSELYETACCMQSKCMERLRKSLDEFEAVLDEHEHTQATVE